jgi:hypothetical protein
VYLLKIFVFNEIFVGILIIFQVIFFFLCSKIAKSPHLEEIEGKGFGVSDEEVK